MSESDELFGSDNKEYQKTTAKSELLPPQIPSKFLQSQGVRRSRDQYDNPHDSPYGHRNMNGQNRHSEHHKYSNHNNNFYSENKRYRVSSSAPVNVDAIATLKLGAIGHADESLRVATPFQQPREVTHFSRTSDGKVHFDDRCLRRFRPAVLNETGADLNKGFESFVEKKEEENPFQDVLQCLRNIRYPFTEPQFVPHFVTFRNNLNKILGTAYNRDESWEMGVHKRGQTIYLDVHKPQKSEMPLRNQNKRFMYYGYSYEKIATESRLPADHSDRGEVVDPNVEFCSILKTKLGPHRILMGAEIDCYERNAQNQRVYVELKTSRELVNGRDVEIFEKEKLRKFWIQSFLAGVPKVVVGFRDDTGQVARSEAMSLKQMTDRVKSKSYWEAGVCLAFADKVLCWLYGSLTDENQDCVLKFVSSANRLDLVKSEEVPSFLEEHCKVAHK